MRRRVYPILIRLTNLQQSPVSRLRLRDRRPPRPKPTTPEAVVSVVIVTLLRITSAYRVSQRTGERSKADLVAAPVVKLGRAGRGVIGDHGGLLQCAAVLQVGRDAGGPEGVIADPGPEARRPRPALDHGVGVRLRQGRTGQPSRAPANGAK